MSIKIKVGMDPEFMVKFGKEYVYPRLVYGNPAIAELPSDDPVAYALHEISSDEFGHCAELRPEEATTGKGLVLNMIDAMAELPTCFTYHSDNTHRMPKKLFFKLVRTLGHKEMSESKNIYGQDILDDCPADLEARKNAMRLVFCGCHMHISATERVVIHEGLEEPVSEDKPVKLPMKLLVGMFDDYLFDTLKGDRGFDVGRYRSRGFYETKYHGGFEYRSLGASAMTPTRVRLIADIMISLAKLAYEARDELLFRAHTLHRPGIIRLPEETADMLTALARTKRYSGNLRKLWVPFD